jgi:hypothetical protein
MKYVLLSSFPVLILLLLLLLVATAAGATTTTPLYDKGYAKGVADAKASPNIFPPLKTDEIDCENMPDLKPGVSGGDWCNGYRQGFVDTIMNR